MKITTLQCVAKNTVYASTFPNVRRRNIAKQARFTMCGTETLFIKPLDDCQRLFHQDFEEPIMIEKGLYYATPEFATMIKSVGGTWNDTKHRPIVCLIKSSENPDLYWAIPMGKLNHRDQNQQNRLNFYLNLPQRDIRSCYYHLGRTTTRSIFFISDAIPITDKYIDNVHVGADNKHYIIKNANLAAELERKLLRILSFENSNNNSFRQHITDVKNYLLQELSTTVESNVADNDS